MAGKDGKDGFLRHGCDEGFVEVHLQNDDGKPDIVFRREFDRRENDKMRINGKPATFKDARAITNKFNIQVENLCQFLPQDRVCEFAQMNAQKLLLATERAVGTDGMIENHEKLIEYGKQIGGRESTHASDAKDLARLKEMQEKDQAEVQRNKERDILLNRIKEFKRKLPWILASDARDRHEDAKVACEEKHAALQTKLQEMEQYTRPVEELAARKQDLDKETKAIDADMKKVDERRAKLNEQDSKLEGEIDLLQQQIEQSDKSMKDHQNKVQQATDELNKLRQDLEAHQIPPQSEVDQVNKAIRDIKDKIMNLQDSKVAEENRRRGENEQEQRFMNSLAELNNVKTQRLHQLQTSVNPDIKRALEFVTMNADKLDGPVIGPVALEINIKDSLHAKYLEDHIPKWLLCSFIVQSKADQERLQTMAKNAGISINVNSYDEATCRRQMERIWDIGQLRQYGITNWLDETFDAPLPVKLVLAGLAGTARVACGTDRTKGVVKDIINSTNLFAIYTPDSFFSIRGSKYTTAKSTRITDVRPSSVFGVVDTSRRAEFEAGIADARRKAEEHQREAKMYEEEEKALQKELAALKAQGSRWSAMKAEKGKLENRIKSKADSLRTLQNMCSNEKDKEAKEALIVSKTVQRATKQVESMVTLGKMADIMLKLGGVACEKAEVRAKYEQAMEKRRAAENAMGEYRVEYDRARKFMENAKVEMEKLHKRAQEESPLSAALKREIEEEDLDAADIEQAIEATQRRVDLIVTNDDTIRRYEERRKKISDLDEKFRKEEKALQELRREIDRTRQAWLTPLRELIADINGKFERNFKEISCQGEVQLFEDGDKYDNYGVRLLVSFREGEEKNELNSHRQSGGEKSVSTMIYLISLQNLTNCPFRVVDEINQGMDARNERAIFHQLVSTACKPGPQYFLITPKLLPDLEYTPAMTILLIYNGPYIIDQKDWKVNDFCKQKRRLSHMSSTAQQNGEEDDE
mmetsp:Transcript_45867/g.74839  ORF Transcript_45867/g.74839 Transcript_45867/m.74839 type:complete len:983 (-) Transcript_45867:11-2959(-)